jgi:hypothetical protein
VLLVDLVRIGPDPKLIVGTATADAPGLVTLNQVNRAINFRGSEGAGTTTLIASDAREQVFALTANRTVVLPSAGIKRGDKLVLRNNSHVNILTVQASNTTEITAANAGANSVGSPTIGDGFVELTANQDSPTTPGHWIVSDVEEIASPTLPTPTGALNAATANRSLRIYRNKQIVTVGVRESSATAAASPTIGYTAALPVRFRPRASTYSATALYSSNSLVSGTVIINTAGNIIFGKFDASNFSGTTAIGTNSELSTFTYNVNIPL